MTYVEFIRNNLQVAMEVISKIDANNFDLYTFRAEPDGIQDHPDYRYMRDFGGQLSLPVVSCGTMLCAAGSLAESPYFQEQLDFSWAWPCSDVDVDDNGYETYTLQADVKRLVARFKSGEITGWNFDIDHLAWNADNQAWYHLMFGFNAFEILFQRYGEGVYDWVFIREWLKTEDSQAGIKSEIGAQQKALAYSRMQLAYSHADKMANMMRGNQYRAYYHNDDGIMQYDPLEIATVPIPGYDHTGLLKSFESTKEQGWTPQGWMS